MADWSDWNKKSDKRGSMGVYSSLQVSGKDKKRSRKKKSEANLAPLPKDPVKRFLAHFRWERIKAYWFSKAGLKRVGKIFAACILLGIIAVGALFVYYKNQLKDIELNDLTIAETVNTYLDRNGEVLWEDKGNDNYRLVVDESEIATHVRQATVAIEDRNFYSHPGVDLWALMRAMVSTVSGKGVQGGSTLTQQLIKQVYFSDEAKDRTMSGLPRKIKELILAIELEKMYSKEQIITMYLNESPYGGRRNGVESAAQTYFGKSAKDLTLAESALLAAVPNNPAVLNPYNENGHEALIARQQKTLDVMVELGYITQEECDEAKSVEILDQIQPESSQYTNIRAPHFVMEVKKRLEEKYGIQTMRQGGYTIRTSLDIRAQEFAEQAVGAGAALTNTNGSDNIAMVSLDAETSQVIAMVGSINWDTPIYGEVNATTSLLEPGSSIKPVLDYTPLFSLKGDAVYGPGSITVDENIDSVYCRGTSGSCSLSNSTGRFFGSITIRDSLSNSLNIGAVKALSIVGIKDALEMLHNMGDVSYCENSSAGLSMAIGSGCTVRAVEHANTYATIARGGTYKDLTYVMELKDSKGKVVESWQDTSGKRVVDEEVAYEISSILSDANARSKFTFGSQARSFGFVVPGVWTASKTGTTTTANSAVAKDSWMISYSTAVSTVVWNGNHDGAGLKASSNTVVRRVVNDYMEKVHKDLYASEGKWKSGDEPKRPSGIQELSVAGKTDIWPSWYNKDSVKGNIVTETVEFNSETGLQASDCTPESLRTQVTVSKVTDPVSGTVTTSVPEPYKLGEFDTCENTGSTDTPGADTGLVVSMTAVYGDDSTTPSSVLVTFSEPSEFDLVSYTITVDGSLVKSGQITSAMLSNGLTHKLTGLERSITAEVTDSLGRTHSNTLKL